MPILLSALHWEYAQTCQCSIFNNLCQLFNDGIQRVVNNLHIVNFHRSFVASSWRETAPSWNWSSRPSTFRYCLNQLSPFYSVLSDASFPPPPVSWPFNPCLLLLLPLSISREALVVWSQASKWSLAVIRGAICLAHNSVQCMIFRLNSG